MQTKQQIRRLLTSKGVSPNTNLGQHFLIDLNLMRLLIDTANIRRSDVVLEVGCGTGSLTQALADCAAKVIAVELDRALARIAKEQLADRTNVEVINTDILDSKHSINRAVANKISSAQGIRTGRFLLVANLPYNVASPVIANLTTGPLIANAMYFTVQKEVADRMTARPGSGDYGTLSVLPAATGDARTIRILKPAVFWPPPKVDSAMVSFARRQDKAGRIRNMKLLTEIVTLFMGHRRKMLKASARLARGNLSRIHNWPEIFEKCSIEPTNRPEQLSSDDYIAIANLCHQRLCD